MKAFTDLTREEKYQFWADRQDEARQLIEKFANRVNEQVTAEAFDFISHNEYVIATDLVIGVMVDNEQLFLPDEIAGVIGFYQRVGFSPEKLALLRITLESSGKSSKPVT